MCFRYVAVFRNVDYLKKITWLHNSCCASFILGGWFGSDVSSKLTFENHNIYSRTVRLRILFGSPTCLVGHCVVIRQNLFTIYKAQNLLNHYDPTHNRNQTRNGEVIVCNMSLHTTQWTLKHIQEKQNNTQRFTSQIPSGNMYKQHQSG